MSRVPFPVGSRDVFLSLMSRLALVSTQLPTEWVPAAVSLVVKRLGREADHSPPSGGEVGNDGAIFPLPHKPSCRAAYLSKPRDKFTVTFVSLF
jgi:hypothetical protein